MPDATKVCMDNEAEMVACCRQDPVVEVQMHGVPASPLHNGLAFCLERSRIDRGLENGTFKGRSDSTSERA
ncbi:hypothetical protein QJS10_CPB21g00231 [Acorus calamus]|uniref:Uncharacterized protein n=1 Tax=Acorus calamus TaxID=4465 RepID=A0AAV9C694_ACOCL|nr:hypothetical protein QJS10_CPB21g00231 [Acorus calamus]